MTMEDNQETSTQKCLSKKRKRGGTSEQLDDAMISMKTIFAECNA